MAIVASAHAVLTDDIQHLISPAPLAYGRIVDKYNGFSAKNGGMVEACAQAAGLPVADFFIVARSGKNVPAARTAYGYITDAIRIVE